MSKVNTYDRHGRKVQPVMPPRPKCPVCGARGYRSIKRIGGQLIHWCRKGHPHFVPGRD